jgi:Domain of unknown function (DUF4157)
VPNAATAAAPATARAAKVVQRACACGAKGPGECESCRKKRLQRKAAPGGQGAGGRGQAGAGSGNVPTGGGSPLAASTRQSLEPLFGVNFDGVRIHADAQSDRLAREFEARAFTFGQDIHFAHGEYRPGDRAGLSLLAHELTHTIQQRGAPAGVTDAPLEIDPVDSLFEVEAEAAARRVLDSQPIAVRPGGLSTQYVGRVQRQATSGATTESATRTIDENTHVSITRTLTPRPCEANPRTESTARRDIFYWDREANAVGMRYSLCHGRVRLSTGASVEYGELVRTGENLLDTLRTNPAAGSDIGGLLQNAIDTTHVTTRGEINLTVDGILSAQVTGSVTVGTTDQHYNVRGVLTITPNGVSFRITGGIDVSRTPLQSTSTYTLEGSATTSFGAITLRYNQIDTSAVGGTSSTDRSISATATIPLPDVGPLSDQSLGLGASVNPDTGGVAPILEFRGHFGGPSRTERVECYDCDCPPPRPDYTCTRTVAAHSTPVVDQTAGHQTLRLLYAYDSPAPADGAAYGQQVHSIGGMVHDGYSVTAIRGYASPEASRSYNRDLAQLRADAARTALQGDLTDRGETATLPHATGEGELLGDSSARPGGEARNDELIRELSTRLTPLTEDQRLDLLGVDPATRSNQALRQHALDDIQAFIDGRDANGQRLGTRARWERIFPFLRRVEVEVDRQERHHDEPVAGGLTTGCQPDDLTWARENMSEIPARQRLPPERCRS